MVLPFIFFVLAHTEIESYDLQQESITDWAA